MNVPSELHGPISATWSGSGHGIVDVDLDGVCADYVEGLRQHLVRHHGQDFARLPDPDHYNLAHATGWPFANTTEYLDFHARAVKDHLYREMPCYPAATDAMSTLSHLGLHLRIVTHRLITGGLHEIVVSDTAHWLEANMIPYMSLCFVGPKDTLNAALHIEDSPETIRILQAAGEQVLIFDQPYNRAVPGPRAHNWVEAVDMIRAAL